MYKRYGFWQLWQFRIFDTSSWEFLNIPNVFSVVISGCVGMICLTLIPENRKKKIGARQSTGIELLLFLTPKLCWTLLNPVFCWTKRDNVQLRIYLSLSVQLYKDWTEREREIQSWTLSVLVQQKTGFSKGQQSFGIKTSDNSVPVLCRAPIFFFRLSGINTISKSLSYA